MRFLAIGLAVGLGAVACGGGSGVAVLDVHAAASLRDALTEIADRWERAGGARLRVPRADLSVGDEALVGLRAEDLFVARERLTGLSARNALPARARELRSEGADVVLRAALGDGSGPVVSVLLTAESTGELSLEEGAALWLFTRTRACHVLARLSASVRAGTSSGTPRS